MTNYLLDYACDYTDDLFYSYAGYSKDGTDICDILTKPRNLAQERRRNAANAQKRANKMLSIVSSKSKKATGFDEHDIFENKLKNAEKKAQRTHQAVIDFVFPDSINKVNGKNLDKLVTSLSNLKSLTKSKEMVTACEEAISTLHLAQMRNGELVAIYTDENILFVTIGFYDKAKLSEFKKDISDILK